MLVYHGTTLGRARRIHREGFLPRKPSQLVWFARSIAYARGRARCQAQRARDKPVVLSCEIDLGAFRSALGPKRVLTRGGNIAIDAPVSIEVLRSRPSVPGEPASPQDLAGWVNAQLGLKHYKGVRPHDPGVVRLAKWVVNRTAERKGRYPRARELFEMARRYLPEWFRGCAFDEERARVQRVVNLGEASPAPGPEPQKLDAADDKVLDCLESAKPRRRVRGLEMLGRAGDEDLFDWCMMFLDDPSPQVRAAAARLLAGCEHVIPEALVPLAYSDDKIHRGAAIPTLARHLGAQEPEWFELGLRDPEPHVRVATAAQLGVLSPGKHRTIFELALYDPNPKVSGLAQRLAAGTGLGKRY